jgi:hypothetical protein
MLVYCDYIADTIRRGLVADQWMNPARIKLDNIGPVQMDLHPTEGYFVSTKKTLEIIDTSGKKYKVTVEEV